MSHKTLVNGTVYEVGGGKTLIDGVAYSIDKGKTLVGGTAYEVGFAKPLISFTIREYSSGTKTRQAEEGMTWGEWVDSEYNPLSYEGYFNPTKLYEVGFDGLIVNCEHSLSVMNSNDWTFPRSTDLIIANGAYELSKD